MSLLNLGTHTPGGFPLTVPNGITNNDQLMAYFRDWKPAYAPGTYRTYSDLGIGMLGMVAAKGMKQDFITLMQGTLFPGLRLKDTYLTVPEAQIENYAQGYTTRDKPIRLVQGVLTPESGGVRTTTDDLLHFIEANMRMLDLDDKLQRAIIDTHTGYYRLGAMIQDLIWEQYQCPVGLNDLLEGNSDKVLLQANAATALAPPLRPHDDVLINKTGSTNGFSTYVAFVPKERLGIVLLANKRFPIAVRVTTSYKILTRLDGNVGNIDMERSPWSRNGQVLSVLF